MEEFSKRKGRKLTFNISDTKYEIISHIIQNIINGAILQNNDDENWDLLWTDNAVSADRLARMKHYQKINHFPGMYAISRKNYLAYNLNKLRKQFPNDYNFFPKTWVIPSDLGEIRTYLLLKKNSYVIVKPEASCQGRGIFLTKKFEEIEPSGKFVIQEYLSKPFLIDSLKFDLRIYVLLTGCCPLRLFVHREGLTRLATEPYTRPNASNSSNMCMHLTNYAINKKNPNFISNNNVQKDHIGHKRSLKSTFLYLTQLGIDTEALWLKIEDMIIKTVCSIQPILAHHYRSSQPDDFSNSMCFEILGFDVFLDSSLTPYVLEVNHTPSFSTDSPLDFAVKQTVIIDALKMLNLDPDKRKDFVNRQKIETLRRNLTGKIEKMTKDDRRRKEEICKQQRDLWEMENRNGFKKIYPAEGAEKYDKFIEAADMIWKEWTGTNVVKIVVSKEKLSKSFMKFPKRSKFECSEALVRLAKPRVQSSVTAFPSIIYKSGMKKGERAKTNMSCVNLFQKMVELGESQGKDKRSEEVQQVCNKPEPVKVVKQVEKRIKKISLKEILSLDCLDLRIVKIKSQSRVKTDKIIN